MDQKPQTPDSIIDAYFRRLVDEGRVCIGVEYSELRLAHLAAGVHDELLAFLDGIEDPEVRKKALTKTLDRLEQTFTLRAEMEFAAKVPDSTQALQPELLQVMQIMGRAAR